MKRMLHSALMSCALVVAMPATAQTTDVTVASKFFTLMESGKLTGCQLGFSVLRADNEYNGGRPTLMNGLLVFRASNNALMIRLGAAMDEELQKFHPPDQAYLFARFTSNMDEFSDSFLSDDPDFRMFAFAAADKTVSALVQLTLSGSADVGYRMPGMTVDARFTISISGNPDVAKSWGDCLSALADDGR